MTTRKFYGSHFHSLTVHAPVTFRLVSLRSLVPVQEERTFGDLRKTSLNTANRQCGKIIDNVVLRHTAQQRDQNRTDYSRQQYSVTSRQAKLLPKMGNTTFTYKELRSRPTLFQAHFQRIADYMCYGKDSWWSLSPHGIIHDGPEEVALPERPNLAHFWSTTADEQQKILKETWNNSVAECEALKLLKPLYKIRIHEEDQLSKIFRNEGNNIKILLKELNIMQYEIQLYSRHLAIIG